MTQPMDDLMRPYAWHTEDHLIDKTATTYSKDMAYRWECKGWPVVPMYTADQMREYAKLAVEAERETLRQVLGDNI